MWNLLFTNAAILGGLAVLAVPIVIHLWFRRRKQRIRFSSVRFFKVADAQMLRKRRLSHLFLLMCRLLLLLLIVFAFAQPYLPTGAGATKEELPEYVAFVLDRSGSMRATDGNAMRWTEALGKVREAVGELSPHDRAILVTTPNGADRSPKWRSPTALKKELAGLQPGYGVADLGDGIRRGTKWLLERPQAGGRLVIVGDLQWQSCRKIGRSAVPEDLKVEIRPVGEDDPFNLDVTRAWRNESGHLKTTITTGRNRKGDGVEAEVTLSLDGERYGAHSVADTSSSREETFRWSLPEFDSGWHRAKITIKGQDDFKGDDDYFFAFYQRDPIATLCLKTSSGNERSRQPEFFLKAALSPAKSGAGSPSRYRFRVETKEPGAVSRFELFQGAAQQRVLMTDLVIMPGLGAVGKELAKSLKQFVRAGGGLVLFVNDAVSPVRYQSALGELLPVTLGRQEEASSDSNGPWRIESFDETSRVFSAFRNRENGNLKIPTFKERFAMVSKEGSRVLARFNDDVAFVVSRAMGQGEVVIVNTSASTTWTDWPRHKTFLPWLHYLGRAVTQRATKERQASESYEAGRTYDINVRDGVAAPRAIIGPEGDRRELESKTLKRVRLRFETPGLYRILDGAGKVIRPIPVNIPPEESDLRTLTASEVDNQLVRSKPRAANAGETGLSSLSEKHELWPYLLASGALLLILELVLANRTYA